MEPNYKISIPKPCHEDWNQMTPDQTGRFCNSCVKSVVDFTNMKASEIQQYLSENQDRKVCGRFRDEQINTFNLQVPKSIFNNKLSFHKAFLLALFIAMGSTLFSCKNHDNETLGEVTIIDTVKQAKDSAVQKEILGKVDMRRYDSLVKAGVKMPPLPPPPKVDQVKFINEKKSASTKTGKHKVQYPITTGEIVVSPQNPPPVAVDKNFVYQASRVEVQPTYPGGLIKFYDAVKSDFNVPEEYKDITGKIIVTFIVDSDGSLTDIKVLRGINAVLDKEALRFMNDSQKWIPGEQNGQKVKVSYTIPIKITAQE